MIDESRYVECTSSAIQAMILFKKLYPHHRNKEIQTFVTKAAGYLESIQRPDGSWYICCLLPSSTPSYMFKFHLLHKCILMLNGVTLYIGMETGVFASHMVLGLPSEDWQQLVRATKTVLQSGKVSISCSIHKERMVDGERATSHAQRRYLFLHL